MLIVIETKIDYVLDTYKLLAVQKASEDLKKLPIQLFTNIVDPINNQI